MGAVLCREENDGSRELSEANRQIDSQLRRDQLADRRVVKILLLGSADSGKSTIAKQMRILHLNGFNETELINYRYMIHTNFITTYHCIVRGICMLGISVPDKEKELLNFFDVAYTRLFEMDHIDQINVLRKIRSYKCVQMALERLNDIIVPDNSSYLLKEADRILQERYRPTEIDVLHARASTTGVHEMMFEFRRFNIRLIDVGGQKTERRKWIHCFDKIAAIMFVSSMSCYNRYLDDDPQKNRVEDSVELFKRMFYNEFLLGVQFILFLNKKDLFEERLKIAPLEKYFPTFQDRLNNFPNSERFDNAVEFMKGLYTRCKQPDDARRIYSHITNATDTKNIEFVFGATCDIVLQKNLSKAGMS